MVAFSQDDDNEANREPAAVVNEEPVRVALWVKKRGGKSGRRQEKARQAFEKRRL